MIIYIFQMARYWSGKAMHQMVLLICETLAFDHLTIHALRSQDLLGTFDAIFKIIDWSVGSAVMLVDLLFQT